MSSGSKKIISKKYSVSRNIDREKVPEILCKADILLATVRDCNTYSWGMNLNKIYDYMAAGRPIIFAGRAPNNPIKLSKCGLSVNPESPNEIADAILKISDMTLSETNKMAMKTRDYAIKNFDHNLLGKKFESMLVNLI